MSSTDLELLDRYTREKSEDAFSELVQRNINLVFSAALRQVHNIQIAQEVAQSVFIELARQASTLAPDTLVSAWLYQVTRHKAVDVIRSEVRRHAREQIAQELTTMNATNGRWSQIRPLLDEGMLALEERDRAIVLLRYFQNKSVREVADTLKINEDAARKRVNRAVERLRHFFARRGVTTTSGALMSAVAGNAVQAAPLGLSATITTAARLSAETLATATAAAATKAIAMTTLQKALIGTTITITAAFGIYQAREASNWRSQAQAVHQQKTPADDQLQQLIRERDDLTGQLAAVRGENDRLKQQSGELLKLRGEVGLLRKQLATAPKPASEQHRTASSATREDSSTQERDDAKKQSIAKMNYARVLVLALSMYAQQNQGQYPTNFVQAVSLLDQARQESQIEPADLPTGPQYWLIPDQYEITYSDQMDTTTNAPNTIVIREKEPWQPPGGGWLRTYGFADGHIEVHKAGPLGFEDWEAKHGLVLRQGN